MSGVLSQSMDVWVPGTPKSQPSKNASLVKRPGGPDGRGKPKFMAITRTPSTANDWKDRVQTYATRHAQQFGWQMVPKPDPVYSEVWFVFKRPQNHVRSNGGLKDWAPTFHTIQKDRDNLEKALNDPLKWAGIVEDDGQICMGGLYKVYHRRMEGALIILRAGDDIPWPVVPEQIRDTNEVHELERQPVLAF